MTRACVSSRPWSKKRLSGCATIWPTVLRGFSELYGLWKMYWICRRDSLSRARAPGGRTRRCSRDLAGEVRVQAGDAACERRLPGARLADERDAFARPHDEVDVEDELPVAVRGVARRRGRAARSPHRAGRAGRPGAARSSLSAHDLGRPDGSGPRGSSETCVTGGNSDQHRSTAKRAPRREEAAGRAVARTRRACPGCPRARGGPTSPGSPGSAAACTGAPRSGRARAPSRSRRAARRT